MVTFYGQLTKDVYRLNGPPMTRPPGYGCRRGLDLKIDMGVCIELGVPGYLSSMSLKVRDIVINNDYRELVRQVLEKLR